MKLEGKVALVTGSTSGIGKEIARGLAREGAEVFLHGRDRRKVEETQREIGGSKTRGILADFSSLEEVRRMAKEVLSSTLSLDILVLNAGVMLGKREVTEDGFEKTLQVNHLAPFLLANLLVPHLCRRGKARVVVVASEAHRYARIRWEDLGFSSGYSGWKSYAQSKLMNILFARELSARFDPSKLSSNAVHPGTVRTRWGESGSWAWRVGLRIVRPFLSSPKEGADTPLYVATSPDLEGVTGRYFLKRKEHTPSPKAMDSESQRRLWEMSARFVGL